MDLGRVLTRLVLHRAPDLYDAEVPKIPVRLTRECQDSARPAETGVWGIRFPLEVAHALEIFFVAAEVDRARAFIDFRESGDVTHEHISRNCFSP